MYPPGAVRFNGSKPLPTILGLKPKRAYMKPQKRPMMPTAKRADDDDRADLLLELADQQGQAHGGKAGDELIEVGLKRGDHLIKGGSTDGVVHRQRFLDTSEPEWQHSLSR